MTSSASTIDCVSWPFRQLGCIPLLDACRCRVWRSCCPSRVMEEGPSFPLGYSLRVYHHHCLRLRHVLFVIVLACFFSTFLSFVKQVSLMDHSPYRSLTFGRHGRYHTFSNTDTRFAPNKKGRACFFSVWRPFWTASALDNWQLRYSAQKMEDAIIRSAP